MRASGSAAAGSRGVRREGEGGREVGLRLVLRAGAEGEGVYQWGCPMLTGIPQQTNQYEEALSIDHGQVRVPTAKKQNSRCCSDEERSSTAAIGAGLRENPNPKLDSCFVLFLHPEATFHGIHGFSRRRTQSTLSVTTLRTAHSRSLLPLCLRPAGRKILL